MTLKGGAFLISGNFGLEEIRDQELRAEGVSLQQLRQGKQIADIEQRMMQAGYTLESIFAEWEGKTPDQIVQEYAPKDFPAKTATYQPEETDWLPVTVQSVDLTPTEAKVLFGVCQHLRNGETLHYTQEARIMDGKLQCIFQALAAKQAKTEIRLQVDCRREGEGLVITDQRNPVLSSTSEREETL